MSTVPLFSAFVDRVRELLAQVSYRDWIFHVAPDADGCVFLTLRFLARDESSDCGTGPEAQARLVLPARQEGTFLQYGRKWRLSAHMTDTEIVQTALKAVLTAEEHEARECFRFRGRAIYGPHYTLDALIAAHDASQPDARPAPSPEEPRP